MFLCVFKYTYCLRIPPPPPPQQDKKTNTTHPTTKAERQPPTPNQGHGLVVSKPNSVSGSHRRPTRPNGKVCRAPEPTPLQGTAHPTNRSAHRTPTDVGGA